MTYKLWKLSLIFDFQEALLLFARGSNSVI